MNDIKGIHYREAAFDKDGKLVSGPNVPAGTTDLIVVSHGWNNERDEAEKLYTKLFGNFVEATKDDPAIATRKLAIVGIIWPAKKFDALMTQTASSGAPAGGAASIGAGDAAAAQTAIRAAIDRVAPLFEEAEEKKNLERLRELVPSLEDDPGSQKKFVEILRQLLDPRNQYADQRHSEDSSDVFFEGNPQNIFDNAKQSAPASATEPAAPATKDIDAADPTGHAAGFLDVVSEVTNAVSNLLNVTTYFEMKKRAGTVGKNGVGPLIDKLASVVKSIERIHLVGHSFGARVVTAAADSSTTPKLHSLSLLQAPSRITVSRAARAVFFAASSKTNASPARSSSPTRKTIVPSASPILPPPGSAATAPLVSATPTTTSAPSAATVRSRWRAERSSTVPARSSPLGASISSRPASFTTSRATTSSGSRGR